METIISFGEYSVNAERRVLERSGETVLLKSKTFDLLLFLVSNQGRTLSKNELLENVWKDQFVEENNLSVHIAALRKVFGEKKNENKFIVTIPGTGYRFVPPVAEVREPQDQLSQLQIAKLADTRSDRRSRGGVLAATILVSVVVLAGLGFLLKNARSGDRAMSAAKMRRLTTQGNVANIALSTDGISYAYILHEPDGRRSLWTDRVDGSGEPANIIPATDELLRSVVFDPAGTALYYTVSKDKDISKGTLFKIDGNGSAPQQIREEVPENFSISPDGRKIAYVKNDRQAKLSRLLISEISDTEETQLISRSIDLYFGPDSLAWSADGERIALSAATDEDAAHFDIFIYSIADSHLEQLTKFGWDSVRSLKWEKSGRGLFTVASEADGSWGSQVWHISFPQGERVCTVSDLNVYGGTLGITPSGDDLLVLQTQHQSNIWVAPSEDIAAAKPITAEMLGRKSGWNSLEWTADGYLTYGAFEGTQESIWQIDREGRGQKKLSPDVGPMTLHSFSSDGSRMVFESEREGKREVWTANGNGSDARPVTAGGGNKQPHISPDGKYLAYRHLKGDSDELIIRTIDGEASRQIAKGAAWPRFSPDGSLIACVVNAGKNTHLAILRTDTAEVIRTFDIPEFANFNLGLRWTPDGKAIAYRDWKNGIWLQQTDGGSPNRIEGIPKEKIYAFNWSSDGKWFAFTRGTEIRDAVMISGVGESKK